MTDEDDAIEQADDDEARRTGGTFARTYLGKRPPTDPVYPLTGQHGGAPQLQLVAEVVGLLAELRYPPVEHPRDVFRLDAALHDFLYKPITEDS